MQLCTCNVTACECLNVYFIFHSRKHGWYFSLVCSHSVVKLFALRSARTEEPVHLQIPAVVLVVGLGAPAVKVC